jgi:hypothetical protein
MFIYTKLLFYFYLKGVLSETATGLIDGLLTGMFITL